jgi:hypothetical protein
MALITRRTRAEIQAERDAKQRERQAEAERLYTNPAARQVYLQENDTARANSIETHYLQRLEEERIEQEQIRQRAHERLQSEREARDPQILAAKAQAEAREKAAEQNRLQAEQKARQAREAQAILDNQERARQTALAREAEIEKLNSQVGKPAAPVPFVIPNVCPYCSRDRDQDHPLWCIR